MSLSMMASSLPSTRCRAGFSSYTSDLENLCPSLVPMILTLGSRIEEENLTRPSSEGYGGGAFLSYDPRASNFTPPRGGFSAEIEPRIGVKFHALSSRTSGPTTPDARRVGR